MSLSRFAEDANYWDTTVHPAKSLGEIQEILEDFGVTNTLVTQGQAGGQLAWVIRFEWQTRTYRFLFTPLKCRLPNKVSTFAGKKRSAEEQARYQMGRIAVYFVKAVLTAAEAQPAALFGFLELPGPTHTGGLPATAAELDTEGLTAALPKIKLPVLGSGDVVEGDFK
jgi:hypothetical protein